MKKILVLSLTILLSSCASLISGSKQELAFDSNQQDVEIYIDGKLQCRTPCIAEVKRGKEKMIISARKFGYEYQNIVVERRINVVTAFNAISLLSGTFGLSTDNSTGAIWEYQPSSFYITIRKEPTSLADKIKYQNQDKVREFVLRNYEQIQIEVFDYNNSSKEYLRALQKISLLEDYEIINIIKNSSNEVEAANRVTAIYAQKQI